MLNTMKLDQSQHAKIKMRKYSNGFQAMREDSFMGDFLRGAQNSYEGLANMRYWAA